MLQQGRMQAVADRYVAAELFSGIEWQVECEGLVLQAGKAGYADWAAKRPIADAAIYRLYSMTKPILSVLALRLIDQGRFRLFDPVAKFAPEFASMVVLGTNGVIEPARRLITVEDLLTHRAGFSYEFIHGCHVSQYYRAAEILADGHRSLKDMMTALAAQPLAYHPGTAWRYSIATCVLAHIIQNATGCDLAVLLKEEIFDPLGMLDTGFSVAEKDRDRLMEIYGPWDLSGVPPTKALPHELLPRDVSRMYPADNRDFRRGGLGLFGTLQDYLCFARMLLTGRQVDGERLLAPKTHALLQINRLTPDQMPIGIGATPLPGYGWGLSGRVMLDTGAAMMPTSVGEFGWSGAALTHFWVDPSLKMIGVVLTQFLGSGVPLIEDMRTAAYQSL